MAAGVVVRDLLFGMLAVSVALAMFPRWFLGRELDGQARTNATWRRGSTRVLHHTGYAVRWHHWPYRRRAGVRTGGTLGVLGLAAGLLFDFWLTLAMLCIAVGGVAGFGGYMLVRRLRATRHDKAWMRPLVLVVHYRLYVRPLRDALTHVLDVPPKRLAIDPDRSRVVIGLPHGFTGGDQECKAIERAVGAKIGIEAPEADWSRLKGRKPQVTFLQSEPPPRKVAFAELLPAVRKAAEHEVFFGKGRRGAIVDISVDRETPHTGISMGTGDGKSTFARLIACQLAFHGALLLFLDPKLISHMWARGLPNVAYAGTEEEIDFALLWLQAEVRRRNKLALTSADIKGVVHANVGPRIAVFGEELNTTQNRLKAWWRSVRQKGDPARPPSSEALDEVLFTGRQVRVNVFQIGQRLSAKASGSGDARDTLGSLVFCDPSQSTWNMIVGTDTPRPPAAGHQGRYQLYDRKTVTEFQAAYVDEEAARAFASCGEVALPRYDMPCVGGMAPAGIRDVSDNHVLRAEGSDQVLVSDIGPDVAALPAGAATLEQLVIAGAHPSKTVGGARKQATRDPGHPKPVGRRGNALAYDLHEIHAYKRAKERVSR